MKKYLTVALCLVLTACSTFYTGVVTISHIHDQVVTELASLYKQGLVSEATDKKIEELDAQFFQAANVLKVSLEAYKISGQADLDQDAKVAAVKKPLLELISILSNYAVEQATKHQNDLNKTTQL